jgi:urea carboxylase
MTEVRAEITANVWQVRTEVGAVVAEGDELVILESMKMEIPVAAPSAGTVAEVRVAPDDNVQEGDVVVVLDP